MSKILLCLTVLFVLAAQVEAKSPAPLGISRSFLYYPNGIDSIIGTVTDIRKNTIAILDEVDHRTKTYTCLSDMGDFKTGERVHLFYYPTNGVVKNIVREPLQQPKEGRNLGYILKR